MAGQVSVAGEKAQKAGQLVDELAPISVPEPMPFVSRGGLKLAKALAQFDVEVRGRVALDVGASTGGFADCLLQNGARHVYAIDVGYGQLAWSIRQDERVSVFERTNIRHLTHPQLYGDNGLEADLAVIDTSFISLRLVLPAVLYLLEPPKDVIALIKPQFEAGKADLKKGVVRDPLVHERVLTEVLAAARGMGLGLQGLDFSPIRGPEGNVEFLAYWREGEDAIHPDLAALVKEATATAT